MKFLTLIIFGLLTTTNFVFGQTEKYLSREEGTSISENEVFTIKDGKYTDINAGLFITESTSNYVELGYEQGVTNSFTGSFELEIDVEITGIDALGTSTILGTETLSISYLQMLNASDDNRMAFTFSGYPWIEAKIIDIRNDDGTSITNITPENVYLELGVIQERYYQFDATLIPGFTSGHLLDHDLLDEDGISGDDFIEIHWGYIKGAHTYELEWTYVEAYKKNGDVQAANNTTFAKREFRKNSTRIRTHDQSYKIPLVYEDGYLIYRLRAIGKIDYGTFILDRPGKWSTGNVSQGNTTVDDFPNYIQTYTHEASKNWQYQVTYAEGGKKKEVVSYFDGSLKNRQTVSLLNTQNEAIAGEKIYDGLGRGVVEILPVPTSETVLKYYDGLNVNTNQPPSPYSYQDFDMGDTLGIGTCTPITVGALSSSSGAEKYYSSNASQRSKPHDYIPKANGYPFSQVEYTPDNTGRIRRSSGVGVDFNIDSEHTTEYFYSKPQQVELDRLFGADVGYKGRYKKNMVKDANGQVSVSYLDPQGRVIATALAGDAPSNLETLKDENGPLPMSNTLTVDLLSKVDISGDSITTDEPDSNLDDNNYASSGNFTIDDKLVFYTEEPVVKPSVYYFDYSLEASSYIDTCMDQTAFPFIYDLDIKVQGDCGGSEYDYNEIIAPLDADIVNGNYGTPPTTTTIPFQTQNQLEVGTYSISKELQVNQEAVHHFADEYIDLSLSNGCIPSLQDFIDEELNNMPSDGCNISCEDCLDDLGTEVEYITEMFAAYNIAVTLDGNNEIIVPAGEEDMMNQFQISYEQQIEQCNLLCESEVSLCETSYFQMKGDVSPDGQYGATTGDMSLSVFSTSNILLSNTGSNPINWQNPDGVYLNEDNMPSKVFLVEDNSIPNGYLPEVVIANSSTISQNSNGTYYTSPENLANLSDFLDRWEDSWSEALVKAHPEYCYYEWCIGDQTGQYGKTGVINGEELTSENIDNILLGLQTYADAIATTDLGSIDIMDYNDIIGIDPYFTGSDATTLLNKLQNFHNFNGVTLDVLGMAVFTHTEGYVSGAMPSLPASSYNMSYPGGLTTIQKDNIWATYRSLIVGEKQKLREILAHQYTQQNGCFNGCIGSNLEGITFDPFADNFWFVFFNSPIVVQTISDPQPCGFDYFMSYKDKKPIWFSKFENGGSTGQGHSNSFLENGLSYNYNEIYEETGQCPLAFDLQNFLNSVINDQALSTTQLTSTSVDLVGKPYLPYNLFEALGGFNLPSPPSPGSFIYDAQKTAQTLTIDLGETGTPCVTTLTLPSYSFVTPNALDWNYYLDDISPLGWSIHSFSMLHYISDANGTYDFSIKAWVDKDLDDPYSPLEEVIISGTTCLMIGNCHTDENPAVDEDQPGAVSNNCPLNDLGEGLLDLLIQVDGTTTEGLDPTAAVSLNSSNFSNNALLNEYGANWQITSFVSNVYTLSNTQNNKELYIQIDWPMGITPDTNVIAEIQGITVNPDQTFQLHFSTTATGAWDPSNSYSVNGSIYGHDGITSSDFLVTIGDCYSCTIEDNPLLTSFRSHVVEMIAGGEYFSPTILDYFGVISLEADNLSYNATEGSMSYDIVGPTATGGREIYCSIQISSEPAIDFTIPPNDPDYISNVSQSVQLISENAFTFMVQLFDDSWVEITVSTCMDFGTCPCEVSMEAPSSCETAYEEYYTVLNSLSLSTLSYSDFCSGNYEQFLNSYLAYVANYDNIHNGIMTGVPGITDFVDCQLAEWLQQNISEAHEAYNNTLTGYTVTLEEFEQIGDCSYCLDLYRDYLIEEAPSPIEREEMMFICGEYETCPAPFNDIDPNDYTVDTSDDYDCYDYLTELATEIGTANYNNYIDSVKADFIANYINAALSNVVENFTMEKPDSEYNYTLYYYDQAGNLVRTVPPKGVVRMDKNNANWASDLVAIQAARNNYDPSVGYSTAVLPDHTHINNLGTTYAYNALNQLVWQHTPDGGESYFWYDALGRLVASQNAKQEQVDDFSYTRFDALGRTVEVGALEGAGTDVVSGELQIDVDDPSYPNNWTTTRYEVTKTIYDENVELTTTNPLYFRNRIGSVIQQEELDVDNNIYRSAYHYEYDVHGNVKWMQQDFRTNVEIDGSGLSATTEYEYDLISGNVLEVKYQTPSGKDLMIHRYYYDADNRIVDVETSRDGYYWNNDVHYIYYDHGPLARVELGNDKVQGIDYAYTIQGWLKGVNATSLNADLDMGKDGYNVTSQVDEKSARDAFGFALTYYDGDYEQVKTTSWSPNFLGDLESERPVGTNGLFNGNIAQMSTAMMDDDENIMPLISNDYTYDQLQRIKSMYSYVSGTTVGTDYDYASVTGGSYSATYSYDANGNLDTLRRNNQSGQRFDNIWYDYDANDNQLNYVYDYESNSIGSDLTFGQNNYSYDAIGQLIADDREEIVDIQWTTAGKVKYIERGSYLKDDVAFKYDPMGNRVLKMRIPRSIRGKYAGSGWDYTIYMRDAQGNVMATYDMNLDYPSSGYIQEEYYLSEQHIYGSSRVGMIKSNEYIAEREFEGDFSTSGMGFIENPSSTVATNYDPTVVLFSFGESYTDHRGDRYYELANHLGNVLEVITDRKIPEPDGSNNIDYYLADVVSYSDYYAFGMQMPGRSFQSDAYRYGFNGMEKDDEISGEGNSYTTEFRQYDPRLGRWKSRDPLFHEFPWQSPYVAFDNNPVYYTDPKGLAAEGGGDDPKEGQTRVENGRNEIYVGGSWGYDASGGEDLAGYGEKRENSMTLTLTKEYEEPGFLSRLGNTIGNWFRSVEKEMKGNAKWSFGFELTTHDGEQQGNYEDASKAEKDAWTVKIYWDDIEDVVTALKRLDKELPKEFKNSPSYSGPSTFIKEAKKWIGPAQEGKQMSKQMAGKNKPKFKKQDKQTIIQDAGGSYMYDQVHGWLRRNPCDGCPVQYDESGKAYKDSTYQVIPESKVPENIKNQLK